MYIYICVCVCVCVCVPPCVWVILHFVWWTLVATWVTLSSHKSSWPCSIGMCSRRMPYVLKANAVLFAQSSQCDCLDPCMRRASTCLILWRASARHGTSMLIRTEYTDAKPCRCAIAYQTRNTTGFSSWKWGISIAIFLCQNIGENSILCAMTYLRWSITGFPPRKSGEMLLNFHCGNLATTPNIVRKHRLRPYLFWNRTTEPNTFKALKANANSSFSTANVLKLWFYQNKGLSMDRRCGVPNTFPTHNQTFELKNQDFLPIHIRLGKTPFFLA